MLFKNKQQEIHETWFKFIISSLIVRLPFTVLHGTICGWKENGMLVLDLC